MKDIAYPKIFMEVDTMSLQVYGNYTPGSAYSGGISGITPGTTPPGTAVISKEKNAANEVKQYSNGTEYADALSKKYEWVKDGRVTISASYLSKCANDPEEARKLEENVSLFEEISQHGYESAKQNAAKYGGKVTNYTHTWSIDGDGNITMMSSTTTVVENGNKKSWKELNAEWAERSKAKKEEAAKLEKKRAEKKAQEERRAEQLEKRREEKEALQTYEVKVVGKDARELAAKMTEAFSRGTMSGTAALDVKA